MLEHPGDARVESSLDEALLFGVLQSFIRVLAAAGISRQHVSKAVQSLTGELDSVSRSSELVNLGAIQRDCMEVMCLWRRDQRFVDEQGLPRPLTVDDGDCGFAALCRRAATGASPEAILQVLLQFSAVNVLEDGSIVAKTPTFMLRSLSEDRVVAPDGVLRQLSGFLGVLEHNLIDAHEGRQARFERACSVTVAAELLPIFERFLSERGQEFMDAVDEWLERQKHVVSRSGQAIEIGVGVYSLHHKPLKNMIF